jgi:hypothetical protein
MKCLVDWIRITPFPTIPEGAGYGMLNKGHGKYTREDIVAALQKGGTYEAAGQQFNLSIGTIQYYVHKFDINSKEWKGQTDEEKS